MHRLRRITLPSALFAFSLSPAGAQTNDVRPPTPTYTASEIRVLQEELTDSWKEIETLRREVSQRSERLKETEESLSRAKQANEERILSLLKQTEEATALLRASKERIAEMREANQNLQTAQAELRAEVATLKAQRGGLDASSDTAQARARVRALTADLATEREALRVSAKKFADLQTETEELRQQVLVLREQTKGVDVATEAWRKERDQLVQQNLGLVADLERRLTDSRTESESLRARLTEAEGRLAQAQTSAVDASQLAELRARLQSVEAERLAYAAQADRLTREVGQFRRQDERLAFLEKELTRARFDSRLREASVRDHAHMIEQFRLAMLSARRSLTAEVETAQAEKH